MKTSKKIIFLVLLSTLIFGCKAETENISQDAAPEILSAYKTVKIITSDEGFYRLRLSDIGWENASVEGLAITHRDQPVPIMIENGNDQEVSVLFYGQTSNSPYTAKNIYILQQNANLALPILDKHMPESTGSQTDYLISTVHLEENHLYTPKVENGNPWHWYKIVAPQIQTVELDLPDATDQSGNLRVTFWGITTATTTPDHHIRVGINGEVIGETEWDGAAWHTLEAPIPSGILMAGKNTVEIHATGETEARIDIVNLDWIEIDYRKKTDNLADHEFFRAPEDAVQLAGFEGPLTIFEISNPTEISRIVFPSDQPDSIIINAESDQRYLTVREDGYLNPDQILPFTNTPDLRVHPGAEYIAIGHPELLEPLEPLLNVRHEQGMDTLSVPIEAIYDQFNGGMAEPEAIQTFLRYAVENWDKPPKYVLLVGDTHYDYYGYQTPVEKYNLPAFFVQTVFGGETSSDVLMAQINDDAWPDLAIGRVPAQTVEQVKIFVGKTLKFEKGITNADWNQSILAIADGQEESFQMDAEHFIDQFPNKFQTQLIAPEAGAVGTNEQIATEIEKGQLLTAYFGHGSVNMWGKDSLFTTQDTAELGNEDRFPVILNFTCLTGLFTHPVEESMAESLLFNPNGGAVAVLAPSSPTLPSDQTFLSDAFIEAMLQNPTPRLGEITLHAWRSVPMQTDSTTDVMQTFLLFGDPALQIPTR